MQVFTVFSRFFETYHVSDFCLVVLSIGSSHKNTVCKLAEKQNKDTEDSILKDKELKAEIIKLTSNVANLDAKVDQIIMKNKLRDEAQMEEMCNLIETKTRHYINDLEGIPEDEYDSFVRLFNAYRGINGNHGAEAKFNYCIKNLPIISVKTELKN